jgi:archaellum component FlaC
MSKKSISSQIQNLTEKINQNKTAIADLEAKIINSSVAMDFNSVGEDFSREANIQLDMLIQKEMHMQQQLKALYTRSYGYEH